MAALKGSPKVPGSGRKKGGLNRQTREIRELVRGALDELGGIDYLISAAKVVPQAFLGLIGKMIPAEIQGRIEHAGGITINVVTGVPKSPGSET